MQCTVFIVNDYSILVLGVSNKQLGFLGEKSVLWKGAEGGGGRRLDYDYGELRDNQYIHHALAMYSHLAVAGH